MHVNHHGYCHHDVWPILLHLYHCNLRDCSGTQTGKRTLNPAASGLGSGCQENQRGGRTGLAVYHAGKHINLPQCIIAISYIPVLLMLDLPFVLNGKTDCLFFSFAELLRKQSYTPAVICFLANETPCVGNALANFNSTRMDLTTINPRKAVLFFVFQAVLLFS